MECGAAETRAAIVEDGEVCGFFFAPARGDEARAAARGGDLYLGRVRTVSRSLGGAFIDIAEQREAFVPLRERSDVLHQGAAVIIRVRRPALGGKGALASLDWRKGIDAVAAEAAETRARTLSPPRRLSAPADAALQVAGDAGGRFDDIIVDARDAGRLLAQAAPAASIREADAPFEECAAEEALADALERRIELAGGGSLTFDETEGGAVVDVDAGEAASAGRGALNDRVNAVAARRLGGELARRAIGGRVMVDFLPPREAAARRALLGEMKAITSRRLGGRAGALRADGLFDLTIPKTRASLLERATTPFGGAGFVREGRVWRSRWAAAAAARALERALKRAPAARPRLILGADLHDYVVKNDAWRARLALRYGARFLIEMGESLERRGHDLVE